MTTDIDRTVRGMSAARCVVLTLALLQSRPLCTHIIRLDTNSLYAIHVYEQVRYSSPYSIKTA